MTPVLAYIGSFWQWVILFTIVLVVFGAKRLPDVARNLGKSLGEFKKARREFEEELMKAESELQQSRPVQAKALESPDAKLSSKGEEKENKA